MTAVQEVTTAAAPTYEAALDAGHDAAARVAAVRALVRAEVVPVAAAQAREVDVESRFPKEAVDAMRATGLLGALVPVELGGLGHDLREACAAVGELARSCASSAMILAMHHSQVACLVRHASSEPLRDFLREVVRDQLLLASATTEVGIGGNTRSSSCAVEVDPADLGRFRLVKQAPVISYGEYADAVLATARRGPDAADSDQVLVVCRRSAVSTLMLDPRSDWDTLGFRGTCSRGFLLEATGPLEMVCPVPYGEISAATMLPASHLLWTSLWRNLALEATDRARRFVSKAARKNPEATPPGALRLARLMVTVQQLGASVDTLMDRYLSIADDPEQTSAIDFMIAINTLKVNVSEQVVDVVNQAMLVCGIAGYREDSEYSLGRLLRDAHGAAVMVSNDRILANNARLVLVQRGV